MTQQEWEDGHTKHTRVKTESRSRASRQSYTTAGDTTSFKLQYNRIRATGEQNTNPRKKILDDLQELIMGLTLDGHDIILGIDANESLDSNQSKIQQFFDETGLLPIHEEAFNEEYYDENPLPATYSRGSKKIDFMACTPRVMSCVTGCAIEALSSGIKTDHRPLTVDLDVTTLFGGELQRIVTASLHEPRYNTGKN